MGKFNTDKEFDNPTIICGYKGAGMVGALVADHLMKELDFEEIGSICLREVPPIIAVRDDRVLKPVEILYNKKNNILLVFILAPTKGMEWEISDIVEEVYQKTGAKQIVVPEGVLTGLDENLFYFANFETERENPAKPLKNSVISGIASALTLKENMNVLILFGNMGGKTQAQMKAAGKIPSNKAAAYVVEGINKYLGTEIGTEALKERGEDIEEQLNDYMAKIEEMRKSGKEGKLGYIG